MPGSQRLSAHVCSAILEQPEPLRKVRGSPAFHVGEWLSLVEHLVRDQGVGGSNPLSPTNSFQQLAESAGFRGLPKGLTFALPVQVAPKTRATP